MEKADVAIVIEDFALHKVYSSRIFDPDKVTLFSIYSTLVLNSRKNIIPVDVKLLPPYQESSRSGIIRA
jgi:hypothetical protein